MSWKSGFYISHSLWVCVCVCVCMFQPQIEPSHTRSAHVNIEIIGIKKVSITKMTKRPPLFYTQVHLHLHFNSCFLLFKYSLLERSRYWFGAEYKTDEWGKVFILCVCVSAYNAFLQFVIACLFDVWNVVIRVHKLISTTHSLWLLHCLHYIGQIGYNGKEWRPSNVNVNNSPEWSLYVP